MNFTQKVIALQDEAKHYILSKVKDGERLELLSSDELEDDEKLWDLPLVDLSNKYNESCSFAIVGIDRKGESIDLYGKGIGENFGESYIFSPYELTANELCSLADYLK